MASLGGCGDALLPSDYAGPPAGTVAGNVVREVGAPPKDVEHPGVSVEWLGSAPPASDTPVLIDQTVMVQRSARLDTDWELRLQRPAERARLRSALEGAAGAPDVRFSVGKMIYFDDRMADGRFDWACAGANCDVVKAVSAEYVVFVETPPACDSGASTRPLLAAGYHYYRYESGSISELPSGQAMSFVVSAQPPAAAEVSALLRTFADALLASWRFDTLVACR